MQDSENKLVLAKNSLVMATLMCHVYQLFETTQQTTTHDRMVFFRNVLLERHLLFSPFALIFFVTTSRDLMANLLEATMELVGGKEWSFEALAV